MSAAAATADDTAPAKPKSKKLLFIIIGVLVLALIGGGAALFLLKKSQAADEGDGEDAATSHQENTHAVAKRDPKVPPTFLPLDSMVVNLADPGGNRFAQLGITLQLPDSHVADEIKVYMPTIRNGILILISQRTAEQLLRAEGKEALMQDIVAEISNVMGYEYEPPESDHEEPTRGKKKKKRAVYNPIEGVLFSSFIVQ